MHLMNLQRLQSGHAVGMALVAIAFLVLLVPSAIVTSQEPVPLSTLPFSPARKAGPTLFVSGQIARTAAGEDVHGSVADETRQVMENIGSVLRENGYDYKDIVSATVYLSDLSDYQEMNKVYASYFNGGFPARATVGGVQIVFGFKVEISCVAYAAGSEE